MTIESTTILVAGGLTVGLIVGVLFQRSKFCMAAAVSNLVLMRDYRQFHAYLAAIAVALLGTQLLDSFAVITLSESGYLSPNIDWLGAVAGGLLFGFGTQLAGGCIGRTAVRIGEGNVGAILVLIAIGVAATVTLYGSLEPLRIWMLENTAIELQTSDSSLSSIMQLPKFIIPGIFILACIGTIVFTGKSHRSARLMSTGIGIGLLIVAGWWITGFLSQDDFSMHRPTSLAYAGAIANSTYIAATGGSLGVGTYFGIALLFGTTAGSIISALWTHSFHWVMPDSKHIHHLIVGGLLMGVGAILAGGCNIGNGLSGLSTCSIKSLIAVGAIAFGMRVGVAWLEYSEMKVPHSAVQSAV